MTLPAILAVGAISPSTTTGFVSHLSILARPSPNTFLIGLVLIYTSDVGESGRSVIYTCEIALPSKGVGMNMLIGRQTATSTYLSLPESRPKSSSEPDVQAQSCMKLIPRLVKTLEGVDSADGTSNMWSGWLRNHEHRLRSDGLVIRELLPEATVRKLLSVVFGAALRVEEQAEEGAPKRMRKAGPYAARIVKDLLERNRVTDAMWPGGVVANALLPCEDWVSHLFRLKERLG